jgi:hypothetical protein
MIVQICGEIRRKRVREKPEGVSRAAEKTQTGASASRLSGFPNPSLAQQPSRQQTPRLRPLSRVPSWWLPCDVLPCAGVLARSHVPTSKTLRPSTVPARARCVRHTCALPTGEHCPRGLICLSCTHAQPQKSAVPIFRQMLASHQRSLGAAREHNEPAGQIASRELEIVRIKGALQRAEELSDDVAAAIEVVL